MKHMVWPCLALALLLAPTVQAEPIQITVSVTAANQYVNLPTWTQSVLVVSDSGSDTCWARIFTDIDAPAAATTAAPSNAIPAGVGLEWTFMPPRSPQTATGYPVGVRDSESFIGTARARYYRRLAAICGGGDTATWRVYVK